MIRCCLVLIGGLTVVSTAGGCRRVPEMPKVVINGQTFILEVADTADLQRLGLSGRASLPADRGMLFVFGEPADRSFYMKDCYFPIDIAFLDAERRIINLTTMAVEPDPSRPQQWYDSDRPAKYVLETVGGTWERIGARPGTVVEFTGSLKRQ